MEKAKNVEKTNTVTEGDEPDNISSADPKAETVEAGQTEDTPLEQVGEANEMAQFST